MRHIVVSTGEAEYQLPDGFGGISSGFTKWTPVNDAAGSVHQEFGVCQLDSGGGIESHLHTFEKSIYVLEGELRCDTPGVSLLLGEGDYGVFPVARAHALSNVGTTPARWAEMSAPQPRRVDRPDVFPGGEVGGATAVPVDARDPRDLSFGNIKPENMDVGKQSQDLLAQSASMRTALLAYSGISVKMMVDSDLGATLSTMFMVQYQEDGIAGPHDHPFEESYLILEGQVEAKFEGVAYRMGPGDIAYAGVAAIHEFTNVGEGIVRWLETQAPQPPGRYSYRWGRDWKYVEEELS